MKKKFISVLLVLLLISSVYGTLVLASEGGGTTGGSSFDWSGKMDEMTTGEGDAEVLNPINDMAGTAITVAQVIAVGVAIIMLIVLAMKYMLSAPSDRADIKKQAVVYVIGAVVMFACTGILEIIRSLSTALD